MTSGKAPELMAGRLTLSAEDGMETPVAYFSSELVGALTVLFAVCILVPTMYYVWNVYRRKLSHIAILGGLAAFFIFGYLVAETLLRLLAPASRMEAMGMWPYALVRALCVAASETAGISFALWYLHRQHGTIRVPIGFGLGFRLFEMFYLGALNTLLRLSTVMSVNQNGPEEILSQVNEGQREAFELQLRELAESSVGMYWMSAVDYACRFILAVVLARLIWYAFEGGRLPEDKRLIGAAFGLDFLCELMLALHAAGASYPLCASFYYVFVALGVCLIYAVSRRRDDPQRLTAEHVRERNLPRRRR